MNELKQVNREKTEQLQNKIKLTIDNFILDVGNCDIKLIVKKNNQNIFNGINVLFKIEIMKARNKSHWYSDLFIVKKVKKGEKPKEINRIFYAGLCESEKGLVVPDLGFVYSEDFRIINFTKK